MFKIDLYHTRPAQVAVLLSKHYKGVDIAAEFGQKSKKGCEKKIKVIKKEKAKRYYELVYKQIYMPNKKNTKP